MPRSQKPLAQYKSESHDTINEAYEAINALGGVFDPNNPTEVKLNKQLDKVLDELEWLRLRITELT